MPISDIFTPSFLMCLGTCLLLIGLLGMYLMQKLSEQNHKITSMFELVSTMAEEMNVIRANVMVNQFKPQLNTMPSVGGQSANQELLPVSDDDEDDDEDDDDDDDENEDDDEDEDEDDDEDEDPEEIKIKSINFDNVEGSTFNLVNEIENLEETQILEDDDDDDDDEDENDEEDDESVASIEELKKYVDLDFEKVSNEPTINLKSINISDLEEHKSFEVIDYKKLSLPKLKSLVLEKGVVSDASKLKKNELLKLLGSD